MNLYELKHIAHHYGGPPVLSIDHWQIRSNRIHGLAGPNGSGKTTLLKLLGFIEKPSRGELLFNGRPTEPFAEEIRNKVACLPQDSFLLKRTVHRNVSYGLDIRKEHRDREQRVRQALEWVDLAPDVFARRPWYALSGGEMRRVALAARLALQPQVLVLDEPTASVDEASARKILEAVMKAHQQWGATLVIASHDMQWLHQVCDEVFYLFRGHLVGTDRLTYIFGPWSPAENGNIGKSLTQDQQFIAPMSPPASATAVASLEARKISIYTTPEEVPARNHYIQGVLIQLGYDKNNRGLHAQVLVGTTTFYVDVPAESTRTRTYLPGQPVTIAYDPKAVRWHG